MQVHCSGASVGELILH